MRTFRNLICLTAITLLLSPAIFAHSDVEIPLHKLNLSFEEVPVFEFAHEGKRVVLEMDYAQAEIRNPQGWKPEYGRPYKIELVFSKYPVDLGEWMTGFNNLLQDRFQSLYALDANLLKTRGVDWKVVLQTQCASAAEAQRMFHGFVIWYHPNENYVWTGPEDFFEAEDESTVSQREGFASYIDGLFSGALPMTDKTVTKVLERNRKWKNMLVVCDWTGPMYPFGVQAMQYHNKRSRKAPIKHFVFFNDGNKKREDRKRVGKTGGLYFTQTMSNLEVLYVMERVMWAGTGDGGSGNDLEAVRYGMQKFDDYDEIILIANNSSDVRDMPLLQKIDKPVRVILCGTYGGPLNADYLRIAARTGGSVHTVDDDILNPGEVFERATVSTKKKTYQLKGKSLFPVASR